MRISKPRCPGYLIQQDYKEGSFVKKGQLLFQIDPRPFPGSVGPGARSAGADARASWSRRARS